MKTVFFSLLLFYGLTRLLLMPAGKIIHLIKIMGGGGKIRVIFK